MFPDDCSCPVCQNLNDKIHGWEAFDRYVDRWQLAHPGEKLILRPPQPTPQELASRETNRRATRWMLKQFDDALLAEVKPQDIPLFKRLMGISSPEDNINYGE